MVLQELSDSSTLRDEIRNFKEKISILESAVKKLEMDLAYEKNEKEDSKNTSDLKLEQLGEKIKVMYVCVCARARACVCVCVYI
jgi:hypothetical protein